MLSYSAASKGLPTRHASLSNKGFWPLAAIFLVAAAM
jgi:hypothetical protein